MGGFVLGGGGTQASPTDAGISPPAFPAMRVGPPAPSKLDPQQPPPKGSNPGVVRAFLDRKAPYDHALYIRHMANWRKADLYIQSLQWLRPSFNVDPTRTPHWSQIEYNEDDPDAIPMPVYNEMLPLLQNEAARLGRPEYKPYVRPTGANPDAKTRAGASRSTEVLLALLDDMNWDEKAEMGYHHMPLYGGWWLKSWWDASMENTVRVPVLTAQKCPECGFTMAAPELQPQHVAAIQAKKPDALHRIQTKTGFDAKSFPVEKHSTDVCLNCDDHAEQREQQVIAGPHPVTGEPMVASQTVTVRAPGPPKLQPYTPADKELFQQDSFGQNLGKDEPLGEWKVKTCSPYDMFPENIGVDVLIDGNPQGWREILEVHVESLDWVRSRFPDKAADVRAETSEALLKWHPIAGERAIFYSSAVGTALFRNHVRVKEYHKKPFMEIDQKSGLWKMNRGRSIMMAGSVLLLDGDFLMESKNNPGTLIPRVVYDYAPWELRTGGRELQGIGLCETLFDAQDNINEAKSQTQDTRQRMASPKWLVARSLNLDYEECGGAGSHWLYDPAQEFPELVPKEVGSTTISPSVSAEIGQDIEYMGRVAGRTEVEQGSVPSGVSAAAAIQILAEQTAEKRRPRIRRIRKMFERIWGHGLELNHEFVREDRVYKTKNEASEWVERTWTGMDIMGQTDVRIDPEPEADTSIQKQERIRDGIRLGVINPNISPKAAMTIAKDLSIPSDLYNDQNQQYESAEREFLDFFDLGREPLIDPDLDDNASHYDQHGTDCHGEKWRDFERVANWNQALAVLWGWEQLFPQMEQNPQISQAWPKPLELRILGCWQEILAEAGYFELLRPSQEKDALGHVLRFRAHMAAHKQGLQGQQAAAQQGAPVAAAPAAPATVGGMMPTPGGPPQQPQRAA